VGEEREKKRLEIARFEARITLVVVFCDTYLEVGKISMLTNDINWAGGMLPPHALTYVERSKPVANSQQG
jgi:hypothetical protein